MNNIVNLNNTRHEEAPYFPQESELYFKTWERPIYFRGGDDIYYDVADKKAIVRLHNDRPVDIGIVGKNYKVLPNKELCQSIEACFIEAMTHEQLKDCYVKDSYSHHGATCYRQYIFPSITTDINSKHSEVGFRTIISNGYDGTSSFKLYSGAIDFFCTNGMVSGVFDITVRRHTAGLTIPSVTDKVKRSVDIFYKQADIWKHWVDKAICDEDAEECFKAMPNSSEKMVAKLMRQFHIEALSHGRTVWALYSAATFYATHSAGEFTVRNTQSDHTATTLMNRERQVRSWINTETFEQLAA